MKIEQSSVAINSCHSFSSECEFKTESTKTFRTVFDGLAQTTEIAVVSEEERQQQLVLMLESLIARMLEYISGGKTSRVTDLREVLPSEDRAASVRSRGTQQVVEWTSETTEIIREHESTDFGSTGKIQTADGRSLDFTLSLEMCRDFSCERKVTTVDTAVLRDPLVINFDGKAAELSGKRFAFDLDSDGKSDSMSALASGSAYLAIDSNTDGRINDGSELFGTRSGNGFADLTRFDDDGNCWLDENDDVFERLRIWQPDPVGKASLETLHDRGVGALYLGSTETPFSLTDPENRLLAQIRSSGLYLREDGSAGTLQQVDLAV